MLNFIWILLVRNQEKPSKQEKNDNAVKKKKQDSKLVVEKELVL